MTKFDLFWEMFFVDSLGQGAPFKNGQLHLLIKIHIKSKHRLEMHTTLGTILCNQFKIGTVVR